MNAGGTSGSWSFEIGKHSFFIKDNCFSLDCETLIRENDFSTLLSVFCTFVSTFRGVSNNVANVYESAKPEFEDDP